MGKVFDTIDDALARFLAEQKLFFVATAPLARDGHVNLSPKGLDSFRVLGPRRVGYLDLTGSGVETIAHARENGRITLMFCALSGAPRILRLYGRATIVEPRDPGFGELAARFPPLGGVRSIVVIDVTRIADSCGFGVPRFEFVAERHTLLDWAEKKGSGGVAEYQRRNNLRSLDGLPGVHDSTHE